MTRSDDPASLLDRGFRVPKHVAYRTFALETVVVNLERGIYHGLNPTAGRMLQALERSATAREAATKLAAEFGEPTDVIERDLVSLCSDLLERGLIEVA